jgi:hypothetical protein
MGTFRCENIPIPQSGIGIPIVTKMLGREFTRINANQIRIGQIRVYSR